MKFNGKTMTAYGGFVEAAPQYELIEEITIEEDTDSIEFVAHPITSEPYDFSAITVIVNSPANASAGSNDHLIIVPSDKDKKYLYYYEHKQGIGTSKRKCIFKVRNDHGLCEAYSFSDYTSNPNVYSEYTYASELWRNVAKIYLTTYPAAAKMVAGTNIKIYGIRG